MVFVGSVWPEQSQEVFKLVQTWFQVKAGWLYISGVAIFLIFIIFVMLAVSVISSLGRITPNL
ncbi:hypothetical protein KT99_05657 [Shewanella benthica KT99]|uniref:Uncharacterized protein n=1 Tax=Shewanella benthica KT99 TaxID=314608 RepID=A9DFM6_9GAMM|nr:BCCT family transporter [Shewanella benthica]EDP99931.1 hypothetical protein KT99_05657 [Shewanella benthica KT99]